MKAFLTIITFLATSLAQDLVFPAVEENDGPGKQPERLKDTRIPVHILGLCPPNQLLYPGDQKYDWTCDCGPGFIYYPEKDGCFRAYRKGPCETNQYLVLPKKKVIPECIENPCKTDGVVQYKGKCYELDKTGEPCKPSNQGGGVFGVNTTTLEIECLSDDPERLSLIKFPQNCPPGSRRGATHCRSKFEQNEGIALLATTSAEDLVSTALEENDGPGKLPEILEDIRFPVYIPDLCPPNQLLYRRDQKGDWTCDCGPGYIYYPKKDECFKVYRKGPCETNQYLVLSKKKLIPQCIRNPCKTDGIVQYKGKCYELDKSSEPCKPSNQGGGVLGVNTRTLEIECLLRTDALPLISSPLNCPPGSRRGATHCI